MPFDVAETTSQVSGGSIGTDGRSRRVKLRINDDNNEKKRKEKEKKRVVLPAEVPSEVRFTFLYPCYRLFREQPYFRKAKQAVDQLSGAQQLVPDLTQAADNPRYAVTESENLASQTDPVLRAPRVSLPCDPAR